MLAGCPTRLRPVPRLRPCQTLTHRRFQGFSGLGTVRAHAVQQQHRAPFGLPRLEPARHNRAFGCGQRNAHPLCTKVCRRRTNGPGGRLAQPLPCSPQHTQRSNGKGCSDGGAAANIHGCRPTTFLATDLAALISTIISIASSAYCISARGQKHCKPTHSRHLPIHPGRFKARHLAQHRAGQGLGEARVRGLRGRRHLCHPAAQ